MKLTKVTQIRATNALGFSLLCILANRTTILANNTAFEIFMVGDDFGIPYLATQTFTIVGDRAITVMYIAESHEFETYLSYYDYMVESPALVILLLACTGINSIK